MDKNDKYGQSIKDLEGVTTRGVILTWQ